MFKSLETYCNQSIARFNTIPTERTEQLRSLAALINETSNVQLVFICTHNSRRSHFGQVWSQIAAHYYNKVKVQTYSGGTEATAFHPNAIAALERAGCRIHKSAVSDNPSYEISFGDTAPSMTCFSKEFNHSTNPASDFVAIMTCNSADEACPIVQGASHRVALTYLDPKVSDDTAAETQTYDERCQQIATEMLFLFSQAAQ